MNARFWMHCGLPAAALTACLAANPALAQEGKKCPMDIPVTYEMPYPCGDGSTGGVDMDAGAVYAWKALIALSWPAQSDTRDAPDKTKNFGDPGARVWETMRSKVELYPGDGSPTQAPHGVTLKDGKPTNGPRFGYDEPPVYVYSPEGVRTADGQVRACKGQEPVKTPAWTVLDETTQIGNNQTFAGVLPATPTKKNSQPQLIRYGVKMNQDVYSNIVQNQYWYSGNQSALSVATANYTKALADKSHPNPTTPYVDFSAPFAPTQQGDSSTKTNKTSSVEVKMSWRPLTEKEAASGRFFQAPVRYFEVEDDVPCWREDRWGLVGMHLISFTAAAPWGIWSTFEQADNILTADGKPTEDVNGNIINTGSGPTPTSPELTSNPNVLKPTVTKTGDYCATPGARLFFRENPKYGTMPSDGAICVNSRWHAIPKGIAAINDSAHSAIRDNLAKTGKTTSPWLYYKLINVQATPVDFDSKDNARFSSTASYYLANATIETDYSLGMFTGDLKHGVPRNITDTSGVYYNTQLLPFQAANLGFLEKPIRMGGCAGCHAFAATIGQDFSFALGDNVKAPESPTPFKKTSTFRNYKP